MLSPLTRFALAAIPVGLATVFIPDHSPRALALFLVAHSAIGMLLFLIAAKGGVRSFEVFGYAGGGLIALGIFIVVLNDPSAAQLSSVAAIAWGLNWTIHWLVLPRTNAAKYLVRRDALIQQVAALALTAALVFSFADPIASTGFVGIYLVASGLHLAIVAASPKVG